MPTSTSTLALAVTLMFEDSNSDKEYHIFLYRDRVITAYGRRGRAGNFGVEVADSVDKSAAFFWKTVRSKTGKGYRVADAMVVDLATHGVFCQFIDNEGNFTADMRMRLWAVISQWIRIAEGRLANGIAADQPQLPFWEVAPTPRTARQGLHVVLALTDPECDEDVLARCAYADASERFLWPLATSHPACTDDIRAGRALLEMGSH